MAPSTKHAIPVKTQRHNEMINITADVAAAIPPGFNGACLVFCRHTTAGLTINENADPDVTRDIIHELERLVPWKNPHFRHVEGNSAAHVRASLVGSSVTVPIEDGKMMLGVWQGIYFCEFDGPRARQVVFELLTS
jgi:secondary thiamine-phosphate synthase enzyme